jgi:hypothetical protein
LLETRVEALTNGFVGLQAEAENLKQKVDVQQGEIAAGKKEIAAGKEEISASKQEIAAGKAEIAVSRREIRNLEMHNELLGKRFNELVEDNQGLESKVLSLTLTVADHIAHSSDDIESIKRVYISDMYPHSLLIFFSKLTLALTPLHLRVLLDTARQKMLRLLQRDSWEDLRGQQTMAQLLITLQGHPTLTSVQYPLTSSGLNFLCSFNNVRRDGNTAAHTATQQEVRDAVQTKALDKQERRSLENVYAFAYDELV